MDAFLIIHRIWCNLWFFAEEKDNSVGSQMAPLTPTCGLRAGMAKASRAKKIPVFHHTSE